MLRIAVKMLRGDHAKYLGLVFGITFTSFLVAYAGSYLGGFMTHGFALVSENPNADVWVMDPAVQSTAAVALNEGLRCKKRLWRERGRQQLEAFRLAPWASRRRRDLLELMDRLNPMIAELRGDFSAIRGYQFLAARAITCQLISRVDDQGRRSTCIRLTNIPIFRVV